MALLLDKNGNGKEVSSEDVQSYLSQGFVFSPDQPVTVETSDGDFGTMDALEASDFLSDPDSGYKYVSPETLNEIRVRDKHDNLEGQLKATAEAGARALTFGASDLALEQLGTDPQDIQDRKLLGGSMVGEAAAFVAPWSKAGKIGKFAGAGINALDKVSRKAAEKVTKNMIKSKIGKGALKGATQGAVEGGLYEGAQGFSEQMLGDAEFNGEAVIARAKDGIKYGAGLGGLFGGLGGAVAKISDGRKVVDSNIKKLKDDVIPLDVSMRSLKKNKKTMSQLPHVKGNYDADSGKYSVKIGQDSVLELDDALEDFNILDMDNLDSLDPIMDELGFFNYRDHIDGFEGTPQVTILNAASKMRTEAVSSIKKDYARAFSTMERTKKGWNRLRNKKVKTKADLQKIGKHRAAYENSKRELKALQESMRSMNSLGGLNKKGITYKINQTFDAIKDGDNLYILKPEKFDSINNTAYKRIKGKTKLDKAPEAALSALGATRSTFKQLDKKFGPQRKNRIAKYAKNMLEEGKFFDGLDKYEEFVERDIGESVFNMSNAIDEIDNYFEKNNLDTGINLNQTLNELKYKMREDFSYPSGELIPSKKGVYDKLINEINALKGEDTSTIAGIREIRQKIDDSVNWNSTPDEMSLALGKRKLRKSLEDEIIKTSDRFEELTELVDKYKKGKEKYSDALAVNAIIEYGQQGRMGNNNIGLTSMILAGDIASTGSTIPTMIAGGAGAMAGREFLRRYGDKIVALHGDKLTNAAKGVKGSIKKSTKAFLDAPSSKLILPSVAVFTPRELELRNLSDYQNYVYDIQPMLKNFEEKNEYYSEYLPETAAATKSTMMRGMKFLNGKMPKNPYGTNYFKQHTPPEMEMRKFERYKNAVANPLNSIKEIESGYASPEGIEVLKEVYPSIYENLKMEFMEQLNGAKPDYRKRLQINKMFGIETDYYLQPQNIQALQQSAKLISSTGEEAGANMQNAGKINKNERAATDAQKITAF